MELQTHHGSSNPTELVWLRALLAAHFCVPADSISTDTGLTALGAGSLDIVNIALAIEQKYKIVITSDDLFPDLITVGDLVMKIQQRRAAD